MRLLVATMAVAIFALQALGDAVHLKNGGVIEGEVTVTKDGAVIKLPAGEVRVSNDAIARIEKKETAYEQYLKRAGSVREDDAEGHYQLGLLAQSLGLKAQARDEFLKTIALKPDHEGAHQALGHRKVEGKWMTLEQEMQAKGLVQRDGAWMTPEAAAKFDSLKAELEAAKAKREAAEAELKKPPEPTPAPAYTFGAYTSTPPPIASAYPAVSPYYYSYHSTVPYYVYNPYVLGYYYVSPWSSYYYVRPYWPRFGISFSYGYWGGYHHRTHHGGGHGGSHHGGHGGHGGRP